MRYAAKADMLQRYGEKELIQITDRAEPYQDVINDDILNNALDDASAQIDLHLAGRYALPLATVPPALVDMCCTAAWYRLNRGRYTDEMRKDYEDVLQQLENIASGKVKLELGGGTEPQSAAAIAKVSAPDRIFNRDTLKGF